MRYSRTRLDLAASLDRVKSDGSAVASSRRAHVKPTRLRRGQRVILRARNSDSKIFSYVLLKKKGSINIADRAAATLRRGSRGDLGFVEDKRDARDIENEKEERKKKREGYDSVSCRRRRAGCIVRAIINLVQFPSLFLIPRHRSSNVAPLLLFHSSCSFRSCTREPPRAVVIGTRANWQLPFR